MFEVQGLVRGKDTHPPHPTGEDDEEMDLAASAHALKRNFDMAGMVNIRPNRSE